MSEMPHDDLGPVLRAVDDIEPAPPDMVERVWAELDEFLRPDGEPHLSVVVERTGSRHHRRRTPLLLAAAAIAALAIGLVFVTASNDRELVPAVTPPAIEVPPTVEPPSTASTTIPTTDEACSAFRAEIPNISDTRDVIVLGDEAAAGDLAEVDAALAELIDALTAGGAPSDAVTDLRLARGALDDAAAALADGDLTSATESMDVAIQRIRSMMADHEPPIDGCINI